MNDSGMEQLIELRSTSGGGIRRAVVGVEAGASSFSSSTSHQYY